MPIRFPRSFSVLRHRDFALVQAGNAVSNLGTWMQYVAIGWALRGLTSWEFALGLSFVAQFGPSLVLAPSAGVLADRLDRRHIMIAGTVLQAFPPLVIGWLITHDDLTIAALLGLAAVGGVFQALTMPAGSAIVPRLVAPEETNEAVSFSTAAINLARVAGPAIGGTAIRLWGLDWAFYLNGLSFFAVVTAWWFVRPAHTRATAAERAARGTLRQGLEYARRNHLVRHLLLLNGVIAVFMWHAPLMPAFARDVLHGDAWTYSMLTAATGIGAVLGAFLAGELKLIHHRWAAVTGAAIVSPLSLLGFAASGALVTSVIALVGFGLGYFLFLTTSQSMLIIATPDHYRGRVMGLFAMSSVGAVPFAGLAGGAVAAALGPRTAVAIACGVILSYAVWFAVTERAVRLELNVDEASLVD